MIPSFSLGIKVSNFLFFFFISPQKCRAFKNDRESDWFFHGCSWQQEAAQPLALNSLRQVREHTRPVVGSCAAPPPPRRPIPPVLRKEQRNKSVKSKEEEESRCLNSPSTASSSSSSSELVVVPIVESAAASSLDGIIKNELNFARENSNANLFFVLFTFH